MVGVGIGLTRSRPLRCPLLVTPPRSERVHVASLYKVTAVWWRPWCGTATLVKGGSALVARAANLALKAAWYQKWIVHWRLRPEEFGGRVHTYLRGAAQYPLYPDLLTTSTVLTSVVTETGSALLPMAYPDGCPVHPSYPAGHLAIAGACITVLKAFFDPASVLPAPVMASPDGRTLLPYTGAPLTVGGELHKLAGDVLAGRVFGGVHWRSDNAAGLRLGEAVALALLTDEHAAYTNPFASFTLTTFDGMTITI